MRTVYPLVFLLLHTISYGQNLDIDSLKTALSQEKVDTSKVLIYNDIAYEHLFNAPDSTVFYADSALVLSKRIQHPPSLLKSIYTKAIGFDIQRKTDSSLLLAQKLIDLGKEFNDPMYVGRGYRLFAIKEREKGNLRKALEATNEVLFYFQKSNDTSGTARALNDTGTLYSEMGAYEFALKNIYKALALNQQLNNKNGESVSYRNIGNVHYLSKDYKKAITFYRRADSIATYPQESIYRADFRTNIAVSYGNLKQLDSALTIYKEVLTWFKKFPGRDGIATVYSGIGNVYRDKGQYEKAFVYLDSAYTMKKNRNDLYALCGHHINNGYTYLKMGRMSEAFNELKTSLRLADSIGADERRLQAYEQFADYYATLGNAKKSNAYWQSYNLLKDSLYNESKSLQMSALEVAYETGKKEDEIKLLNEKQKFQEVQIDKQRATNQATIIALVAAAIGIAMLFWLFRNKRIANEKLSVKKNEIENQNKLLKETEQQLRQALDERTILLKEIHHRVKNNLQVISSLLNLQARESKKEGDINAFLFNSQNRLKSIALIHETLYNTDNLAKVEMLGYIKKLAAQTINASEFDTDDVSCNLEVEPISLDVSQVVPLGLILSELLTNVLKHAFPKGKGALSIALQEKPTHYMLLVTDDGIGYKTRDIASLGLELVTILSEQLNGTFTISSQKGTVAKVSFPLLT